MDSIVCEGKTSECTLSGAVDAGENEITFASASAHFSAGDIIFVAESDGSELECLGEATAVSSTVVTTTLSLGAAKSATATIWTPTNLVEFGIGYQGFRIESDRGIVSNKTSGGAYTVNKIADTAEVIYFTLPAITTTVYNEWDTFIDTTLSGYDDFTFVDEDANCYKCRNLAMIDSGDRINKNWVRLQCQFAIDERDSYAE